LLEIPAGLLVFMRALEDRVQKIGWEITVSKNMCTVIATHPIHNARNDLIVKRMS
jgi:hypothetical protein